MNKKYITFKTGFYYIVLGIVSTLFGNILISLILKEKLNFMKYSLFFLVIILCYIIVFRLFSKSFKALLLKDFLFKVLPTIFVLAMVIGTILITFT